MEASALSEIKEKDLVTVLLEANTVASNTYVVARKLEDECVLSHPLYPNCFIIRKDSELNLVAPATKSPIERCIEFTRKNAEYLGYEAAVEMESLAAYFVINRKFSLGQKKRITIACGKIAAIMLGNDVSEAIRIVNSNRALLDSYNIQWYEHRDFAPIFQGGVRPTPKQWNTVFNLAGFVLAQLALNKINKRGVLHGTSESQEADAGGNATKKG